MPNTTTPNFQIDLLNTFADILELASRDPGTMNDALDALWGIEDTVKDIVSRCCLKSVAEIDELPVCTRCGGVQ